MSAQTIIKTSLITLREEAIENIIQNANKLILNKDYKLGKGFCQQNQFENSLILEIIKLNNCALTNYINYIIENGGEEIELEDTLLRGYVNSQQKSSKNTLYDLWLSKGNSGTQEDFLNILLVDEKAQWDEINW